MARAGRLAIAALLPTAALAALSPLVRSHLPALSVAYARPPASRQQPSCAAPAAGVSGVIARDTRWCGTVLVNGNVSVARGATLSIDPGTTVRFAPYRGYLWPERRLQLRVEGRLLARGAPGRPIRFTSAEKSPRNGDWSMVKLVGARGSEVSHAVFEFSQHGLNIWKTDIVLRNVVIRFNNWEGLYIENHSKVQLIGSRIYANGYNCIAIEQFNELRVSDSYIANCGTVGIHVDASRAHIERSLIEGSQEGVCLDNDAEVTITGNRFTAQRNAAVSCGEGRNRLRVGPNVYDGLRAERAIACPAASQERIAGKAPALVDFRSGAVEGPGAYLDYIPGDRRHDEYPYVYPDRDETREVSRKLGGGIGLTWSVAWDGRHLFTANLDGKVMRMDPTTGKVLQSYDAPGPQPWGMAHDGKLLWINDFARRTIHGVEPATGKVRTSFAAPDPAGGCKGLAHDGKHLYALGWATHRLYQLSAEGKVLSSVPVPSRLLDGAVRVYVAGGLAWDGEAFWGPADRLVRFDRSGRALGWIHSTSERVWDMAWDGEALWTTQRANENWEDIPRLFRVKVRALQPW